MMMTIETLWLLAILAGLGWWTVHGNREYAVFRKLADSRRRAAYYWRWTGQSFLLLTGSSLVKNAEDCERLMDEILPTLRFRER